MIWMTAGLALATGTAAALTLRGAWAGRGARRPWLIGVGWGSIVAGVIAAALLAGLATGLFVASAAVSTTALAVVATGLKRRGDRSKAPREVALEPSERPSKAWRGWLRGMLAGPIGGLAAVGVGLAYVVWVPGAPQTRMVIGGMLVPVLWAGGMAWTLSDDKILRATAVLVGVALVTFASTALRGFS